MKRDSILFYRSVMDALKELPPEIFKEAVLGMCAYGMDGEEPELSGMSKIVFLMAKPLIDSNNRKYQNGKKGGRPALEKEKPNDNHDISKEEPMDNHRLQKEKPNDNLYVKGDMLNDKGEMIEEKGERKDTAAEAHANVFRLIQDLYNSVCGSYPRLSKMSESRKKAISARLNSGYTVDDFRTLFEKAEKSAFLRGKNDRNWTATFDWLIKDSNMAKVLEGNYDDVHAKFQKATVSKKNRFNNFEQREYDYNILEAQLLAQRGETHEKNIGNV